MRTSDILADIESHGLQYLTTVPDSKVSNLIYVLKPDICPNEFIALAVAVGAEIAGVPSGVICQNSGVWSMGPMITGACNIFHTYPRLYVSNRNTPYHHHGLDSEQIPKVLDSIYSNHMLIDDVEDGKLKHDNTPTLQIKNNHKRISGEYSEILEMINNQQDALYVINLGFLSRLIKTTFPENKNILYVTSSMGSVLPISIGIAKHTERKVVAIQGDGATLMHYGTMSIVKEWNLSNLDIHIIVNGAYESTGNQTTTQMLCTGNQNTKFWDMLGNIDIPTERPKFDYKTMVSDFKSLIH